MSEIRINVAKKVVRIISSNDNINIIKREMKEFLTKKKSDYNIRIFEDKKKLIPEVIRKRGKAVELGIPDSIETKKQTYLVKSIYFNGEINQRKAEFKLFLRKNKNLVLRNIIRDCYLVWFPELTAFHGAGIIRNNKGYLFCGPPGEGKSTIAKRLGNCLNDEFIFVGKDKTITMMYGTPFGGELISRNHGVELENIIFIKKSKNSKTRKLSKKEKLIKAITNNFLFNKIIVKDEPTISKEILKNTSKIIANSDAFELSFNLKDNLWRLIDEQKK